MHFAGADGRNGFRGANGAHGRDGDNGIGYGADGKDGYAGQRGGDATASTQGQNARQTWVTLEQQADKLVVVETTGEGQKVHSMDISMGQDL